MVLRDGVSVSKVASIDGVRFFVSVARARLVLVRSCSTRNASMARSNCGGGAGVVLFSFFPPLRSFFANFLSFFSWLLLAGAGCIAGAEGVGAELPAPGKSQPGCSTPVGFLRFPSFCRLGLEETMIYCLPIGR